MIDYKIRSHALRLCYNRCGKGGIAVKPEELIRKFKPLSHRTTTEMAIKFEEKQWDKEIVN